MKRRLPATLLVLAMLGGCMTTEEFRNGWVAPGSVTDEAKYAEDFEACRQGTRQTLIDEGNERAARVAAGALVGAVAAGAVSSQTLPQGIDSRSALVNFNALQGGVMGGGILARDFDASRLPPKERTVLQMMGCLQERGYAPVRPKFVD